MLQLSFIIITITCFVLFYLASDRSLKMPLVSSIWILLIAVISLSGILIKYRGIPPAFLLILLPAKAYAFYSYYLLKNKIDISINYLLTIHVLRIPVEIGLLQLYKEKEIPVFMTFEGWNFDIVMGVTALVILLIRFFKPEFISNFF